MLLGKTKIKFC